MASSPLDQLIARSKQITEDLMTVRRETKIPVHERYEKEMRRRAEDRLFLVLMDLHDLTDGVRETWNAAGKVPKPGARSMRSVRAALDDGQLKLVSGDPER